MKSSKYKLILLTFVLLVALFPRVSKSQTADSARVHCQALDSAHCGPNCPYPCRIVSVENLSQNYEITNVEVDCVDGGSSGMTTCLAIDVTAVPNIVWTLTSTTCSSSAKATLPGSGLPYTHTLLIYECGCCKMEVAVTWSSGIKVIYNLEPNVTYPFGCQCEAG